MNYRDKFRMPAPSLKVPPIPPMSLTVLGAVVRAGNSVDGIPGASVAFSGRDAKPGRIACERCSLSAPNGAIVTCAQSDCPRRVVDDE